MSSTLDNLCVNTIRTLSIDGVQKANSGHPGLPLGCAAMSYVLWTKFMQHNPSNPKWINRDRFVLSAGHGSMLLYSMLHLTGYNLPMDELKKFRQWRSLTPGHPESHMTPGVEATTGPLGQGVGNIVGMAIAREHLAAKFNRPNHTLIDYRIFGICSDGDLMEGISAEASSLAGHLGLGCITMMYDNNKICLDGSTDMCFSENVCKRYESYGWHVLEIDGMDVDAVEKALQAGINETSKPTLVSCRTIIGYGSPNKAGTQKAHGSPLGEEEVKLTKKNLGWLEDKTFYIPDEVSKHMRTTSIVNGEKREKEWNQHLEKAKNESAEFHVEWDSFWNRDLPMNWQDKLPKWTLADKPIATRKASEMTINAIAPLMPWMFGGSADLFESNLNYMKGQGDFQKNNFGGRNLWFGVREHAMGAILNGIALSAPFNAIGATFMNFFDYMKPAVRIAALAHIPVIYVYTHDSIGLGEDGPTHQPIEHLWHMRHLPNLWTMRPADPNETAMCWKLALERREGPTALIFTRQAVQMLEGNLQVQRGGYVLREASNGTPECILMGSGSEVEICLAARELLEKDGISTRVVSMPCLELFDGQDEAYKKSVLSPNCPNRLSIEAGATGGWWKYVGTYGGVLGLDHYGASAPADVLYKEFGLTVQNAVSKVKKMIACNHEIMVTA